MRKKIFLVAVAVLAAVAVSSFVYVKNEYNSMNEIFKANIEALSDGEIIVGRLCMQWKGFECYSLGEKFEDHYPA